MGKKILGGADGTYEEGMIQQEPIRKAGLRRNSVLNPDLLLLLVREEELRGEGPMMEEDFRRGQ